MTKPTRNHADKVIFAMALAGVVTAPLYLLARYNSLACTILAFIGMWGGWSGTLAEAYCFIRSRDKRYVIPLCIGIVGSIFWAWAVYDFNVLRYSNSE